MASKQGYDVWTSNIQGLHKKFEDVKRGYRDLEKKKWN